MQPVLPERKQGHFYTNSSLGPLVPTEESGVPGGVEEAVPADAVSGCCRRNEPERRSAAAVNLPLESVVAVCVGTKGYRKQKHRSYPEKS